MKKFVYGALFLALVGVSITSCEKLEPTALDNQENTIYELREKKPGYFKFKMAWKMGHDKGPQCLGSDFCITFIMNNGSPTFIDHFPCVGPGNNCDFSIEIGFQANDNTVEIDFINPLYYEKEIVSLTEGISIYIDTYAAWLNIPNQKLEKNSSNLFIGKNTSFTENPVYPIYEVLE